MKNLNTLTNPVILGLTAALALIWFALTAWLCSYLKDWDWMGVSLLGFIAILIYFYFTNSVDTDQVGVVSFGGDPIEEVDSGYVFTIPGILSLETTNWRMQYNFFPGEHGLTEKSVTCSLRPIQFKETADSDDPYQRQITTTPSLTMPVSVEDAKTFFTTAHDHEGAADLICEFLNAALLERTHNMTLRDFIDHLPEIEEHLTNDLAANNTMEGLGLEIFGPGDHKRIQILNPGVPADVVASETRAMAAEAGVAAANAEGRAVSEKATGEADAIKKKGKAEAEVAGLTESKVQSARSAGFIKRVKELIAAGVNEDVAAEMVAREAAAGAVAENKNLLVADMGGGGRTRFQLNLSEEKNRSKGGDKKGGK